jgi:glycosyltransferase involved in cell wall biosynthesis
MKLNFQSPINPTGYGIASLNILRSLYLQYGDKLDLAYYSIGSPTVSRKSDYDILVNLLKAGIDTASFDCPTIKIWHQFDLALRLGKGPYYAMPFFELDTFNNTEKAHMSVPDVLFVTSHWAQNVISDNGIKTRTIVVPLGVDLQIFDHNISPTEISSNYVFYNIGKWEVRKGHDILYKLFQDAFPTEKDVELRVLAPQNTNNYSNEQDLKEWQNKYSKDSRIKIFNGFDNHLEVARFISNGDCGVFPSRAEGWNLELLESMAMNKPVITTNYSAHTEYCNKNNAFLVDIDEIESAYDGKAFQKQGNWAKISKKQKDALIDYMRYVYKNNIRSNPEGVKTANSLTWNNTASTIYRCILE